MNLRPLGDRVLIKRVHQRETTAAGIIIPDTAKEKPQEGKVVAVGKGKLLADGKVAPPDVKPGDTIVFGKYAGNDIVIDAEEHLVLHEEDILAVLEG
jgi:chaperonin GroES